MNNEQYKYATQTWHIINTVQCVHCYHFLLPARAFFGGDDQIWTDCLYAANVSLSQTILLAAQGATIDWRVKFFDVPIAIIIQP